MFDKDGHIAIGRSRCETSRWDNCSAFVTLLDGGDGSTIWLRDVGSALPRFAGLAMHEDKYYLAGRLEGGIIIDNLALSPGSETDGILLVLDEFGVAKWAVLISGEDDSVSRSTEVQITDDAIFVRCSGQCGQVRTTLSDKTVEFESTFGSGVAKISHDGVPL